MILEVARLMKQHWRPLTGAGDLQLTYVRTTEPTFLVFTRERSHPVAVVKIGDHDVLTARAALMTTLADALPGAVARPRGIFPVNARASMFVQEGLDGQPWFRLGLTHQTPADWLELRGRAVACLIRFHQAVASRPEWLRHDARFEGALTDLAAEVADLIDPLGAAVTDLVAHAAATLADLAPLTVVWQHGDFVVNNLLVRPSHLAIIDFDDFGKRQTPFLDAFALGLSVHHHASSRVSWHHRSLDLAASAQADPAWKACTTRQRCAFYVYFLLASIADTLHRPARAKVRLHYVSCLRELAEDEGRYLDAFGSSSTA